MTDRIRAEFELFATKQGFRDLSQHMGRYCRPVVRHMWAAWLEQSGRITDMAAALDRSHRRSTELLKQCRDYQSRAERFAQQAAGLAAEMERLSELHNRPIRVCEACAIYPCRCE